MTEKQQLQLDLIGGAYRAPTGAPATPATEKKARTKPAPNLAMCLLPAAEWRTPPSRPWLAVNDRGEVWSMGRRMNRAPRQLTGAQRNRDGYIVVAGQARSRTVCEAWKGPCPPGLEVCHANGIRHDDRPSNLRWGTRRENMQDMADHGNVKGQKIMPADVPKIIRARRRGTPLAKIATQKGVRAEAIRRIATGEAWSHVAPRMKRLDKRPTRRQAVDEFPSGNNEE